MTLIVIHKSNFICWIDIISRPNTKLYYKNQLGINVTRDIRFGWFDEWSTSSTGYFSVFTLFSLYQLSLMSIKISCFCISQWNFPTWKKNSFIYPINLSNDFENRKQFLDSIKIECYLMLEKHLERKNKQSILEYYRRDFSFITLLTCCIPSESHWMARFVRAFVRKI